MSFALGPGDVQSFVDAQNALRQSLGNTASFYTPTEPTWPDGTAINPDTGEPFDSTAVPVNPPFTASEITVLVIEKEGSPLRPQADTSFSASGMREGADIILDVAASDYVDVVSQATRFTVMGDDYDVEEAKPYTLAGVIYRYLVYGAEK